MRLFIALDCPEEIAHYARAIQSQLPNGIKRSSSFHVTILFIGEVAFVEPIIKKLSGIITGEIKFRIDQLTAFPSGQNPRVIVLTLFDNNLTAKLHSRIADALDIMTEKRFIPHITLCRAKEKINLPIIQLDQKEFTCKGFKLYKSTLLPTGPVYECLAAF